MSPYPPQAPYPPQTPLPRNLVVHLAFSLALFVVGLVGLRYVVNDQWGFDIFDFSQTYVKIGAGVIGSLVLFTLFETIASPKSARSLGRTLMGSEYNAQVVQAQLAASKGAQGQLDQLAQLQPVAPALPRTPI